MTTDPIAAVRRALEAALATLPTPENAFPETGAKKIFTSADGSPGRRCVVCLEPLAGHGNAETHPGQCRRRRHAQRQREAYARAQARAGRPGSQRVGDEVGTSGDQRALEPRRTGRQALVLSCEAILAALRTGGPLDERSIGTVFAVTTGDDLHAVTLLLNQLVRDGLVRVVPCQHGPDRYESTTHINGAR